MNPAGESDLPKLRENLSRIETEIAAACRRAGRSRKEVALMAVTKKHPEETIVAAASLGVTLFGENRVQEFQDKRAGLGRMGYSLADHSLEAAAVRSNFNDPGRRLDLQFHLIGHLQSNKSARAVEIFSSIDTLDSLRLAERLNEAALRLQRRLPVLLEIKLGSEESKTGLSPESPEFSSLLERLLDLGALQPRGFMTVPPYHEDLEAVRPYFARLRGLRDRVASAHSRLHLTELSMGMSHDFAIAIEEGSTQVRIGTGLFGARPNSPGV